MIARASTVVEVDASTVYAEGRLAGFRDALNLLERSNKGVLSSKQRRMIDGLCAGLVAGALSTSDVAAFKRKVLAIVSEQEISVPSSMFEKLRELRSVVYHNEWLAARGRPAVMPALPNRDALLARIHAFLLTFPDTDHVD